MFLTNDAITTNDCVDEIPYVYILDNYSALYMSWSRDRNKEEVLVKETLV